MPYFCVVLNGEGVSIPSSGENTIGFYSTRWVKADGIEQAENVAKQLVLFDWTEGEYAGINDGVPPVLSVDSVYSIGLLKYLWRRPGRGHSFYTSE